MLLCAVIVISQLVRLSDVLVAFGLTAENILLPFLYIILPFLPVLIPISFLFSVMMTFTQLSNDGEYTALSASGLSLFQAIRPVLQVSVVLYFVSAMCGVNLEAWGRREFETFIFQKTQTELDNMIRFKIQEGVFVEDFLEYVFYTEKISKDRKNYTNVLLSPTPGHDDHGFVIMAPSARIDGAVHEGNLRMTLFDGIAISENPEEHTSSTMRFAKADIDLMRVFKDRILGAHSHETDYRSYTMPQLRSYIKDLKANLPAEQDVFWRATYLFHSRFANSFVILTFALFGAILGLFDQRHGKNAGYIGTILVVIGSYVFVMLFRWAAENGHMTGVLGAWLPQVLMLLGAAFLTVQKNRLPLSEPILALRNLPIFGRLLGKKRL